MVVTANLADEPRWHRTLHSADTLADDLGSIGAWVGPRTGPDKRTHGEKEDYVLRRLLVAWKEAGRLDFPIEARAAWGDERQPDFTLEWPDGDSLGVEVTEAGEEDYQAWLTRTEGERDEAPGAVSMPLGASTLRTAAAMRKAIDAKVKKFDRGWYRSPTRCDLTVYDNTAWGGFLDKDQVIAAIERDDLVRGFRQIHLVTEAFVFLDLFGNDFRKVDVRNTYEIDYAAWIFEQIERLRRGEQGKLDLAHIAEELEDLGRSERRALGSHLRNLMTHLLKWEFQPDRRGASWRASIDNARSEIHEKLTEMPSLREDLEKRVYSEYKRARRTAAIETGLDVQTFPDECPYSPKQLVDPEFDARDED